MHKFRRERGDTIIEVLIAITVASAVLGYTYSTMNRNLLATRASQERTEATKLAQGQIELLKSLRNSGNTEINDGTYCLNGVTRIAFPGGSTIPATLPDDFTRNYPSECKNIGVSATGSPTTGFYNIAIVASKDTKTNIVTCNVYIRWYSVKGQGQDQVVMAYRI